MSAPFALRTDQSAVGYAEFRRAVIHALRRGIVEQDRRAGLAGIDDPLLPVTMSDAAVSGADWMVALADAWAMVGEILRFYRGRIATEAYLGTARDERAIEMLLGSIGQARDPGSAATALVSLALAPGPGSDAAVVVPRGMRLQTVPGPGQSPTLFQTDHDLIARAAWNRIPLAPAAPAQPSTIDPGAVSLVLAGPVRSIGPGSWIHIGDPAGAGRLRCVDDVAALPSQGAPSDTLVTLTTLPSPPVSGAIAGAIVSRFDVRTKMFGALAPAWDSLPVRTRLAIGRVDGGVSIRPSGDRPWMPANTGLSAPLSGPLVVVGSARLLAAAPVGLIGWDGESWRAIGGGAPVVPVTALRSIDGRVHAGTVDGRLFVSGDGGDSWDEVESPVTPPARRLIPPFARPGALPKVPIRAIAVTGDATVVATDSGIWRSEAIGAGWLAWSGGLPGASGDTAGPVVALAAAADGTLFAGTATGVFARAADARRWSRYGTATDPVRDLVIVDGVPVMSTATGLWRLDSEAAAIWPASAGAAPTAIAGTGSVLAAATATGLHVSADGGRSWAPPEGDDVQPICHVAIAPDGTIARAGSRLRSADREWPGFHVVDDAIDLGGEVPEVVAGSLVGLLTPGGEATCRVTRVETVHRVDFGLDTVVTRLAVTDCTIPLASLDLRTTEVLVASRPMKVAAPPAIAGQGIPLTVIDPSVPALPPGRPSILVGGGHAAVPAGLESQTLTAPGAARSATPELHGNVVAVTEGRTITGEVLGDGDPTVPGQHFRLAVAPLTHVDDDDGTPRPIVSVTVNGAAWTWVGSLADAGPTDRMFEVATAPDGGAILRFGDGLHGASVPRGRGNIVATYSVGIGGAAPAPGQLVTPLQTPVRLASVINPIAGVAGRPPQRPAAARPSAPARWRSGGRLVSLRDYRDAAALAPGVGAARVERLATPRGAVLAISAIGITTGEADLAMVVAADAAAAAAIRALVVTRGDDPASVQVRACRRCAIAITLASEASGEAARAAAQVRAAERLFALSRETIASSISPGRLSLELNRSDDPVWLAIAAIDGGAPTSTGIQLNAATWDKQAWRVAPAEAAWFAPPTLTPILTEIAA